MIRAISEPECIMRILVQYSSYGRDWKNILGYENICMVKSESLEAIVQVNTNNVDVLFAFGSGINKEVLEDLMKFFQVDSVVVKPLTRVHERLYKTLGFKPYNDDELIYRSL